MTDVLEVERRGAVCWLWFNRPEVHNAQNVAMLRRLEQELDVLHRDRATRVLVIAGRGKSFCSGHDLREMADNPAYAERSSTARIGRARYSRRPTLSSLPPSSSTSSKTRLCS